MLPAGPGSANRSDPAPPALHSARHELFPAAARHRTEAAAGHAYLHRRPRPLPLRAVSLLDDLAAPDESAEGRLWPLALTGALLLAAAWAAWLALADVAIRETALSATIDPAPRRSP
jgi:hypothetical protein